MNAQEAISALDADRKAHEAVFQSPKVGEPVYLRDGQWALVENIVNEHHAGRDEFVDILVLRFKDGNQARVLRSEFPTRRTAMPFILYERTLP